MQTAKGRWRSGVRWAAVVWVMSAMGCGKSGTGDAAKTPTPAETAPGNPLTAPVDYLGAQAKGKRVAGKVISMAELTQAIQKFQAMEDRYPQNLEELVSQRYLQAVPAAPPGFRFQYSPQNGEVRVVRQ